MRTKCNNAQIIMQNVARYGKAAISPTTPIVHSIKMQSGSLQKRREPEKGWP